MILMKYRDRNTQGSVVGDGECFLKQVTLSSFLKVSRSCPVRGKNFQGRVSSMCCLVRENHVFKEMKNSVCLVVTGLKR